AGIALDRFEPRHRHVFRPDERVWAGTGGVGIGGADGAAAPVGDAERRLVARVAARGGGTSPRRNDPRRARGLAGKRRPQHRADRGGARSVGAARRRLRRRGARHRARRSGGERAVTSEPRHLEPFLEMLAAERGAARLTIAAYRNDLLAASRFQKHGALDAATGDELRAYLAHLSRQGIAPRSAARKLSALRQFFRFLVLERVREDDPTAQLDAPRLGRPLPKILSQDEAAALLAAARARKGADGTRLVCLLELLYGSGLRVSELVGLPLAAARGDKRFLVVRGKGDKERLVPLSRPARAALDTWLAARAASLKPKTESRYLFPSRGAAGHLTRERCAQL